MRHPILKDLTAAVEAALQDLPKSKFRKLRQLAKQARAEIKVIEDDAEVKERYRAHAQENCGRDGELEFDNDAEVSLSDDGGAYVQGWYWVPAGDANMCSESGCHAPTDNGEGQDGMCGNCADKAEPEPDEPKDPNEVNDGSVCETDGCANAATKVIRISLNAPGDGSRKVCYGCSEAFATGVQHGSFVQNPNYASEPPKPAEHQPAQPPAAPATKVGRTKKSK